MIFLHCHPSVLYVQPNSFPPPSLSLIKSCKFASTVGAVNRRKERVAMEATTAFT